MDLPHQPPLPEEREQPVAPHSSEDEIPTQPSLTADNALTEETEQPVALQPSEDEIPTQLVHPADDSLINESEQPIASSEAAPGEIVDDSLIDEDAPSEPDNAETSVQDEDEDEDFEPVDSQPVRSGVFIGKGMLIAVACTLVGIVLLVALLVFVNLPKDPPTDWIASTPATASTAGNGKTLYYLHWTNQNGDLTGQLKLAANVNKVPQSLTAVTTGLYNRDNHIIYVVIIINGQPNTLTGKINDANDTLTLNLAGAPDQSNQLVFHKGSADDYNQAVKKLG